MREAPIVRQIQLAASAIGDCRLFRNSVAMCVLGKPERIRKAGPVMLNEGDMVVRHGRIAMAGWGGDTADCLGYRTIEITPDMVGKRIAQMCSVEVKSDTGRASKGQQNWLRIMLEAGACAGIVRSVVEAEVLLRSKM